MWLYYNRYDADYMFVKQDGEERIIHPLVRSTECCESRSRFTFNNVTGVCEEASKTQVIYLQRTNECKLLYDEDGSPVYDEDARPVYQWIYGPILVNVAHSCICIEQRTS
jgi:hypothetical protein